MQKKASCWLFLTLVLMVASTPLFESLSTTPTAYSDFKVGLLSNIAIGKARSVMVMENDSQVSAFVSDFSITNSLGLVALNLTNPYEPNITSNFYDGGGAHEMFLDKEGSLLYLADHRGGVEIFNITNPSRPVWSGVYKDSGAYTSVVVKDGIAYAADMFYGLKVINVSDPTNPTLLRSYTEFGPKTNVFLRDDILFVSDAMAMISTKSFGVLKINTPTNITEVANYPFGRVRRIDFIDNYGFMAIADQGTKIMDFSDLGDIKEIFTTKEAVEPYDLQIVDNNKLFVADYQGGLTIFSIDDQMHPKSLTKIVSTGSGNKTSLDVLDGYAFVTDINLGLQLFRFCYDCTFSSIIESGTSTFDTTTKTTFQTSKQASSAVPESISKELNGFSAFILIGVLFFVLERRSRKVG